MPAWLDGSVIYEVNTAAFSSAGDFAGVTARLDDLLALGVNVLWLMPVHPVGELRRKLPFGSFYSVRDYYAIAPSFGTEQDLRRLVDEAHRREMRVIMDIVANHTSWDSVLTADRSFYKRDGAGRISAANAEWTDVAALDYANPKVRAYMIEMLDYWLREFRLDGFRCDVAGLVPTAFWEEARPRLERVCPDLLMLAEWDTPELLRSAFDLDYSWALYKELKSVMAGRAPASAIRAVWTEEEARYPSGAMHLRFADNHDEQRAVTLFGLEGAMAAAVLVFTLDGVPLVYNGNEVGDSTESGGEAMFHRLKVFWPIAERRPAFLPFFQQLIAMRRGSETLAKGKLTWIDNSAPDSVLTFVRGYQREEMLVGINLSNRPQEVLISGVSPGGEQWDTFQPVFGDGRPGSAPRLSAWQWMVCKRVVV